MKTVECIAASIVGRTELRSRPNRYRGSIVCTSETNLQRQFDNR